MVLWFGGVHFGFAGTADANLALAADSSGLLSDTQVLQHQVRGIYSHHHCVLSSTNPRRCRATLEGIVGKNKQWWPSSAPPPPHSTRNG